MGCCGKPSMVGYVLFTVILLIQLLLTALTMSEDTEDLSWIVREDECLLGIEITSEFYNTQVCSDGGGTRDCTDYEDFDDSNPVVGGADDDFGRAANLMIGSIVIICVMIILTLAVLFCGANLPVCGGDDNKVYNVVLVVLSLAVAAAGFFAMHSTAESNAFQEGVLAGCNKATRLPGYSYIGALISSVLALILVVMASYPCAGCIGASDK